MTTDSKNIATSYFKLWHDRNFAKFRSLLSDNVTFIGVLGIANGINECMDGIQGLSNIMTNIVIQQMWADGSDVITWYELHTTKTTIPIEVVNWMRIEDGKINKIRVTFDPRPLLA
jgi:hypothetical protein